MRANLAHYDLLSQLPLKDVLTKLQAEPGRWKLMAGGTDLMVLLNAGKLSHREFIDIWHLKELRFVETRDSHMVLGSLSTYTDVARNATLKSEFPNLVQAALETGAGAIQNRGTLGGNIINASPAADSVPALMAYGAEMELTSATVSRWVKLEDFYTGYKKMILQPSEMLARVRLPRDTKNGLHFFRKVGTRRAQAISKVCVAGFAKMHKGNLQQLRIALGGVSPTITLAYLTQDYLLQTPMKNWTKNAICAAIEKDIAPIDDVRSTAAYRLEVAKNVILQFVNELKNQ